MDPLALGRFVEVVGGTLAVPDGATLDPALEVVGVATHSERVRPGAAFVALAGRRTHGAAHLAGAAASGAVVAVVGPDVDVAGAPLPLVVVDDPLRALQRLAGWWRRQLRAAVVAVVGSNGKTTTKDALVQLLGQATPTFGTPGSWNSQLGVALALLACPRHVRVCVIEVAVSEPGEMAHQAAMVAPDHVVLTNVGVRWRGPFGDRSAQIAELLAIASTAVPGWVLLGDDDEDLVRAAAELGAPVHVQGRSPGLPRFAKPVHGPRGVRVDVAFPGGPEANVFLDTPSDEILADVQLAVSAAGLLGVDPTDVLAALADYVPTRTRTEIWRSPSGVVLVRDVATPDPMAVASGARTTRRLVRGEGRAVVVLAEPEQRWEPEAAERLAGALDAEGVDEVLGVDGPELRVVVATLGRLGSRARATLLPDAPALRRHLLEHLRSGDACLVQTAPGAAIGDVASSLVEAMAPTRLYIDLSAVERNVAAFRRLLGPGVRVMAMVKALAYGTEAAGISLALQESGVDALGVASVDEGVALRQAGVTLPVLVLLPTPEALAKARRHDLTPLLFSPDVLDAARRLPGGPHPVHLEVDTGMHRAGIDPASALDVVHELAHSEHLRLEGLMTHLACADDPDEDAYTDQQLDRFERVVAAARAEGLDVVRHAAATAAALRVPRARYDMVRLGLGLYGLHPSDATAKELELTPAIGLVSRLVQVIEVPAGERVGYGGTYVAPPEGGRVGVVPAGYHDCVPRSFSNFGHVVIAGVRCPIIGRVSMDSMTVDISGCAEATVGSDVLVYGRHGDWSVPLEEVAAAIGTIAYEVMARVGPRVQRIFTRH